MSELLQPPKGVKPERLFRLLIARPRPFLSLTYRSPLSPETPLRVVALRGVEECEAFDIYSDLEPETARWRMSMAELIVRSLYAGSYPAFESVDQIGDLIGDEMETLMAEVQPALRVISPTYGRADWRAWDAALKLGARHGSNSAEAILLGACYSEYAERPDWYFGGCLADLTDGQMMAYRAARSIVLQQRKNS